MVDILAGLVVHILRLGRPQSQSDINSRLSRISRVRSIRVQMVRTHRVAVQLLTSARY